MSLKIKIILISLISICFVTVAAFACSANLPVINDKPQYEKAEQLFVEESYQEAYAAFLRIKPFSKYRKIALLKEAIAAEKLGDWTIAENKYKHFLQTVKKNNSFSERAQYSLAKSYFMNKKYESAIKLFLKIKDTSSVQDYKTASNYFLGKMSMQKNLLTPAKKYYLEYIKNAPTGTYFLNIANDLATMALNCEESVSVAKIFLANQKYDETIMILKDFPKENTWTYLALAYYGKNEIENFKNLAAEGFSKNCKSIAVDDMKEFTDFYLSIQKDYKKVLLNLQKTNAVKAIPDYFTFKTAQYLDKDKKIQAYKEIVRNYPQSPYLQSCLEEIFFDFAEKKHYTSAIKQGEIFIKKFPKAQSTPQIMFYMAKSLQKLKRSDEAKVWFDKITEQFPTSYYAFRASVYDKNPTLSWLFTKTKLPEKFSVDFPENAAAQEDIDLIKLFLSAEDKSIWSEIPFDNLAIRAWDEYQKGNVAKSTYLADKYIQNSKTKIPYSDPVWKLAFPIQYARTINENSQKRGLDSFLMLSLIREESHFDPKARSSSNAIGLMQLLMPTAEYIAAKTSNDLPTESKLENPDYNIALGTTYFSLVSDITGNNPMHAIGGYNGGPNAMKKWKDNSDFSETDEFVESIPYEESKNYIKKVYRSRYNYSKIYEK